MGWPVTTVAAPNFDTGPGQAVPTASTVLTALVCWLIGAHFTNTAAVTRTVTLTDTAGSRVSRVQLPAGSEQPYSWTFRPLTGLKWSADGAGVEGHVWGYT